mmetsp:Transcript_43531/g.81768  ORF Transcript_43531/g.81768 Transcript_43531/m.81768 type:complete len:168 (-) Transcript_43531:312-815(-)
MPRTDAAAQRERAVGIGGKHSQRLVAGWKRSATGSTFLPSWPPTTYRRPSNAALAQPYRAVGIGGRGRHLPLPTLKHSAVASATELSFFPPKTKTSGGNLRQSVGITVRMLLPCALETSQRRLAVETPVAVPSARASSDAWSITRKTPVARRALRRDCNWPLVKTLE